MNGFDDNYQQLNNTAQYRHGKNKQGYASHNHLLVSQKPEELSEKNVPCSFDLRAVARSSVPSIFFSSKFLPCKVLYLNAYRVIIYNFIFKCISLDKNRVLLYVYS